jgi:citrate lyase subunit beta/citryl-CoA lyase
LAVPGSNSKMIEKSRTLLADEIFLDLEDSVTLSQKDTARILVSEELNRGGFDSPLIAVRVNEQNKSFVLY